MGQTVSKSPALTKLSDPAHDLVYTDEAKRLSGGVQHDDFDATKFLLNSEDSLNLQRYLYHGSCYPSDTNRAHDAFRADKCIPTYLTNQQYELIIDTFVDVSQHTSSFMNNTMSDIQDFSGTIMLYGKTAVRFLGFANQTLTDLQTQMGARDMTDQEVTAARKDLVNLISELKTHTKSVLDKCGSLKKDIQQFTDHTAIDLGHMNDIVKSCTSAGGELAKNLKNKQDDLAVWQAQKGSDEAAYQQDTVIAGTTATYACVFPPFSTIAAIVVLGVYIARAVQAHEDMDNDDKNIALDEADIADALAIQTIVAHFTSEWSNCDSLASAALKTVTKIELGFSNMLDNIHDLEDDAGLLDGISEDSVGIALQDLAECSKVWSHIETVAGNYKENCLIKVMNADESAAFVQETTKNVKT